MSSVLRELTIDKGCSFRLEINYVNRADGTPVDLTGYSAAAQFFPKGSSTAVVSLTSVSGITLETGKVTMFLSDAQADLLTKIGLRTYEYNLKIKSATNETTALVRGDVNVNPKLTII